MTFLNTFKKCVCITITGLAAITLNTGCASKGFNRGELTKQISVLPPAFDDKQIKEAYEKKPNLPKPFKLAVYFKEPKNSNSKEPGWRWTDQDKGIFDDVARELKSQGLIADVFPLINSMSENEDLKTLRLLSAKHQADALIIISGAGQIDRYINSLGWTYLFILPTLFVPGSVSDTLFLTNASLWDVKNEYLYLTAEAEATYSETSVAAFGKRDKELLDLAKAQALPRLKEEIKKMLMGVKFK